MTEKQWIKKVLRAEQKRLKIPEGWWGTWRDICGPHGVRVRLSSGGFNVWTVRKYNKKIFVGESRAYALKRAIEVAK